MNGPPHLESCARILDRQGPLGIKAHTQGARHDPREIENELPGRDGHVEQALLGGDPRQQHRHLRADGKVGSIRVVASRKLRRPAWNRDAAHRLTLEHLGARWSIHERTIRITLRHLDRAGCLYVVPILIVDGWERRIGLWQVKVERIAKGVDDHHEFPGRLPASQQCLHCARDTRVIRAGSRSHMRINQSGESCLSGVRVGADHHKRIGFQRQQRIGPGAYLQIRRRNELKLRRADLQQQTAFQTEQLSTVHFEGSQSIGDQFERIRLGADVNFKVAVALIIDGEGVAATDRILQRHRGIISIIGIVRTADQRCAIVLHDNGRVCLRRVGHVQEPGISSLQLVGVRGLVLRGCWQLQVQIMGHRIRVDDECGLGRNRDAILLKGVERISGGKFQRTVNHRRASAPINHQLANGRTDGADVGCLHFSHHVHLGDASFEKGQLHLARHLNEKRVAQEVRTHAAINDDLVSSRGRCGGSGKRHWLAVRVELRCQEVVHRHQSIGTDRTFEGDGIVLVGVGVGSDGVAVHLHHHRLVGGGCLQQGVADSQRGEIIRHGAEVVSVDHRDRSPLGQHGVEDDRGVGRCGTRCRRDGQGVAAWIRRSAIHHHLRSAADHRRAAQLKLCVLHIEGLGDRLVEQAHQVRAVQRIAALVHKAEAQVPIHALPLQAALWLPREVE